MTVQNRIPWAAWVSMESQSLGPMALSCTGFWLARAIPNTSSWSSSVMPLRVPLEMRATLVAPVPRNSPAKAMSSSGRAWRLGTGFQSQSLWAGFLEVVRPKAPASMLSRRMPHMDWIFS